MIINERLMFEPMLEPIQPTEKKKCWFAYIIINKRKQWKLNFMYFLKNCVIATHSFMASSKSCLTINLTPLLRKDSFHTDVTLLGWREG